MRDRSELNLGVQAAGFTVVKSYRPTDDYKDYAANVMFRYEEEDQQPRRRLQGLRGRRHVEARGGGSTATETTTRTTRPASFRGTRKDDYKDYLRVRVALSRLSSPVSVSR